MLCSNKFQNRLYFLPARKEIIVECNKKESWYGRYTQKSAKLVRNILVTNGDFYTAKIFKVNDIAKNVVDKHIVLLFLHSFTSAPFSNTHSSK